MPSSSLRPAKINFEIVFFKKKKKKKKKVLEKIFGKGMCCLNMIGMSVMLVECA